jgi:hypothetical protein
LSNDASFSYRTDSGIAATIAAAVEDPNFPQYGYGVVQAVALAAALGTPSITAIELGVAGGNGLVELERLSEKHSAASRVDIQIVGFDLGSGMPTPCDFRDMPQVWAAGFFRMDEPKLRSRLKSARLVIGDVKETAPKFLRKQPAPIGFISFDLDYYSSTQLAFEALLSAPPERFLPRVICYFDDTVGPHMEMHSSLAGEMLAIEEFNRAHARRALTKINGLRYKLLPHEGSWVEGIYVLHLLDHPQYATYVYPDQDRQFPLDEPS